MFQFRRGTGNLHLKLNAIYTVIDFKNTFTSFAPWRKEREAIGWKNRGAQYKKAWLAGGLPALRLPVTIGE